jgi:hypothetical protein
MHPPWLSHNLRLSKDSERLHATSESWFTWIYFALCRLMLGGLARSLSFSHGRQIFLPIVSDSQDASSTVWDNGDVCHWYLTAVTPTRSA